MPGEKKSTPEKAKRRKKSMPEAPPRCPAQMPRRRGRGGRLSEMPGEKKSTRSTRLNFIP